MEVINEKYLAMLTAQGKPSLSVAQVGGHFHDRYTSVVNPINPVTGALTPHVSCRHSVNGE